MKYLIRLAYNGADYCGWQMQTNGPSVQNEVMTALRKIFGSVTEFSGCSRTDSGVHALDFCASFVSPFDLPCDRLVTALNANLPRDIVVQSAQPAAVDFHARYNVKRKEYLYRIRTTPLRDPFSENLVWHRPGEYDLAAMNLGASFLCGTHDFRSFMAAGSKIEDCTRTVFDAHFEQGDGELRFYVSADGFLYNMVRIMVGTLTEIPHRYSPEDIKNILAACDRSCAGGTAPARGLYLNRVEY